MSGVWRWVDIRLGKYWLGVGVKGSGWGHGFGVYWRVCNMIFTHPPKLDHRGHANYVGGYFGPLIPGCQID